MKLLLPLRRKKDSMAGKKDGMQLCALLLLLFKKRNTRIRLLAVVPESTTTRDIKS